MSMLSEQVKELRECVEECNNPLYDIKMKRVTKLMSQGTDTIETLSAKLAANMERSDMISRDKLIEEIDKELSGVIVKDTYSKGKKLD